MPSLMASEAYMVGKSPQMALHLIQSVVPNAENGFSCLASLVELGRIAAAKVNGGDAPPERLNDPLDPPDQPDRQLMEGF